MRGRAPVVTKFHLRTPASLASHSLFINYLKSTTEGAEGHLYCGKYTKNNRLTINTTLYSKEVSKPSTHFAVLLDWHTN